MDWNRVRDMCTVFLGLCVFLAFFAFPVVYWNKFERLEASRGQYSCETRVGTVRGEAVVNDFGYHEFRQLGIVVREGLCERLDEIPGG